MEAVATKKTIKFKVNGKEHTLEVGANETLAKVLRENFGIQCGFCTPGMVMSAKALLDKNPNPSEEEVKEGIQGNLCRCTGYRQIIESILVAAEKIRRR